MTAANDSGEVDPMACPVCGRVVTGVEQALGMTRWLFGTTIPTIEHARPRWTAIHRIDSGTPCTLTREQGNELVTRALRSSSGL